MNIDELYKKSFQDDEMIADDKVWQRISKRLNDDIPTDNYLQQDGQKKLPRVVKYSALVFGILVISGIIYLTASYNYADRQNEDKRIIVEKNNLVDEYAQRSDNVQEIPTDITKPIDNGRIVMNDEVRRVFDDFEISDNTDMLPVVSGEQFKLQADKVNYTGSTAIANPFKNNNLRNQQNKLQHQQDNMVDSLSDSLHSNHLSEKLIKESDKPDIFCPNVLTPNGDGVNDCLVIKNLEKYTDNSLVIYDRYGKQVYKSSHYNNDFCAENLESGAYIYTLNIRFNGKVHTFNFSLSVIR